MVVGLFVKFGSATLMEQPLTCDYWVDTMVLTLFVLTLLGFRGGGAGALESYKVSLQVFTMCPNLPHLLHCICLQVTLPPSSAPFILLVLGHPAALFNRNGQSLNSISTLGHQFLSVMGCTTPSHVFSNITTKQNKIVLIFEIFHIFVMHRIYETKLMSI